MCYYSLCLLLPCTDFNECSIGEFGCTQRCVNTVGSAYCACNPGFRLSVDKKTCEGKFKAGNT